MMLRYHYAFQVNPQCPSQPTIHLFLNSKERGNWVGSGEGRDTLTDSYAHSRNKQRLTEPVIYHSALYGEVLTTVGALQGNKDPYVGVPYPVAVERWHNDEETVSAIIYVTPKPQDRGIWLYITGSENEGFAPYPIDVVWVVEMQIDHPADYFLDTTNDPTTLPGMDIPRSYTRTTLHEGRLTLEQAIRLTELVKASGFLPPLECAVSLRIGEAVIDAIKAKQFDQEVRQISVAF